MKTLLTLAVFAAALSAQNQTAPITQADVSTPSNPASGSTTYYTKSGKLCSLSPAGSENCTGTGSSGYNPLDPTSITVVFPGCGDANTGSGLGGFFRAYAGNVDNCQSPASANDLSAFRSDTTSSANTATHFTYVPGAGAILAAATFKAPKWYWRGAINSLTNVYFGIGLWNSFAPDKNATDWVGIKFDSAVPDTNYRCIVRTGSVTAANVDTGVAATTGVHTFKVDTTSGTVTCTIDGTAVTASGTFTTASTIFPATFVQNLSTNVVNLDSAWAAFSVSGLTR